jgi:hypothetical protein
VTFLVFKVLLLFYDRFDALFHLNLYIFLRFFALDPRPSELGRIVACKTAPYQTFCHVFSPPLSPFLFYSNPLSGLLDHSAFIPNQKHLCATIGA